MRAGNRRLGLLRAFLLNLGKVKGSLLMVTHSRFKHAADAAVILAAAAILVDVAVRLFGGVPPKSTAAVARASSARAVYASGDRLPSGAPLDFTQAEHSVFVFLRSSCKYCTLSMPFYAKLGELRKRHKRGFTLTAVSSDSPEVLNNYLREHGVSFDGAVSLKPDDMQKYRVFGTPTVLLVNRAGVVQKTWIGKLPETAEEDLLAALSVQF